MSKPNGHDHQSDFVGAGFHRLKDHLIDKRPPKIKWGLLYHKKTDAEKISYLEKLAATMNHAAALISKERDYFGRLVEEKEQRIIELTRALGGNSDMLQSEVTRMNADRQSMVDEITKLKQRIRTLEDGDNA